MTQTRPDSTAGTRQAGWIKPPLVDRPVDRGRKDHQSRPFDRDPARDPPGRPMLPHDKTPHKPRPSLAVEDLGPHAGNPSGLAATLGGRCTMAPPRANGERVSGHLAAAFFPVPQQHDFLALGQGKTGVPAHGTSRYPVVAGKHHRIGNPWAHIIHKRCTSNEKFKDVILSQRSMILLSVRGTKIGGANLPERRKAPSYHDGRTKRIVR